MSQKNLTYVLWENNSRSDSLRGSSASCEGMSLFQNSSLGNKIRKNRPNRFRDFGAIKAQIPRLNLIAESFVAKIDWQRKQENNKSHFFAFRTGCTLWSIKHLRARFRWHNDTGGLTNTRCFRVLKYCYFNPLFFNLILCNSSLKNDTLDKADHS